MTLSQVEHACAIPRPTTGPARVRFAPSPTGDLHIGGVRTALFNWLLARHTGGQFILRVEDTDQQRKVEGSLQTIFESLRWVGLDWDEGPAPFDAKVGAERLADSTHGDMGPHAPYVQSRRLPIYKEAAQHLIEAGHAYECDCTTERLERVRERQKATNQPTGYDGHCRERPAEELEASREAGFPVVVRLKVPKTRSVTFHDAIRGPVTTSLKTISDFVILKGDGFPTYHLANVVDDHAMGITHVLRGEEWLPSTPRHVLLYEGLGYEMPVIGHLPIILAEDRTKLSKRHGATSALEFRDLGYLPDAVFNFLALLGWSPGDDQEVMPREAIVERFTLDRIKEAAAIFDRTKLEWMNGLYIRSMDVGTLADAIVPFLEDRETGLPPSVPRPLDRAYVRGLTPMIQDRLKYLSEAPGLLDLFFEEEIDPGAESIIQRKMDAQATSRVLSAALDAMRDFEPFEPEALEHRFRELAQELDVKVGAFFGSIRVAVTGRKVAPPLFDTIVGLGRERCVVRLERAVRRLDALAAAADSQS